MEAFRSKLSARIKNIELFQLKTDKLIEELGTNIEKYVDRAKETLKKKQIVNHKPKRFMRSISESGEGETEDSQNVPPQSRQNNSVELPQDEVVQQSKSPQQQKSPPRESLRPVRTAKANANKNLKEAPINVKIRNDNNIAVVVKTERVSTLSDKNRRDSAKENTQPNDQVTRASVDEGIHSETDLASSENKRSKSVEIIPNKPLEIDITDEKDAEKMPPPALPIKKKKLVKKVSQEIPSDPAQPIPMRVTRSKIKKEKPSIGKTVSAKEISSTLTKSDEVDDAALQKCASESILSKENDSRISKKGAKKKYPMPILVKIERLSNEEVLIANSAVSAPVAENVLPGQSNKVPQNLPINETITINSNLPVNETVTLENNANVNETYCKNPHDSLMTEDNDEDTSMEVALAVLKEKNSNSNNKAVPPPLPLKFKKNEVFNPYLSSPVKQKVQAFEKHVTATPDKLKGLKYSQLKSGTPSKIAIYGSKTTPINNAKQKYIAAISGSASAASSTSSLSSKKQATKKYASMSGESNEELRKNQAQLQQLEDKKRQREEKQRQVQLQREAIEKQKREQTLQQQREREEKFRKIMQEKEEAKRMDALKKKIYKENQEKKYAEEKARKEEFAVPASQQSACKEPQSASKDDSLYVKMQKQIIMEKAISQKKKLDKNTYSFDMLNTDDSTDDEAHPSKKRPEPPQWSKKQYRQKQIIIQSYANPDLLDALFSSQPINVNLKEIFPTIDARKLIRNSSAVWNTPPRYSQIPKY